MDKNKVSSSMNSAFEVLKQDLSSMRTGRATSGMVENIVVSVYGGAQRLRVMEVASISAPDPETIVISPWDKSIIGDINKGLMAANLGANPSIDGEVIRIAVPPMTGEDRQRMVKVLHAKLENAKVSVRQVRGDTMKDIKNQFEAKEISEDEKFMHEKNLQDLTDEFTGKIDQLGAQKEKELLQV